MKHHIQSKVLKDFKKVLWDLKLFPVNFTFMINDEIKAEYKNEILINYGVVQTDKEGHVISSNDSSYSYHYRRQAENDKFEYYQFLLCLKKKPSEKYYITNRELTMTRDGKVTTLTWKALNGDVKKIIVEEVEV